MLNTCDYLIPLKFASLIIQVIFSITALLARVITYNLIFSYRNQIQKSVTIMINALGIFWDFQ